MKAEMKAAMKAVTAKLPNAPVLLLGASKTLAALAVVPKALEGTLPAGVAACVPKATEKFNVRVSSSFIAFSSAVLKSAAGSSSASALPSSSVGAFRGWLR